MSIFMIYPFNDGTAEKTLKGLAPGLSNAAPGDFVAARHGAIYKDDGTFQPTLVDVGTDDELWVVGHTGKGMKLMGDANFVTINQTEIVARLGECGLRRDANCKVVLYACKSGAGTPPLAVMVATALNGATPKFACANNVWGFTKKVSMKTHDGVLCVSNGKDSQRNEIWEDYIWHAYALVQGRPNVYDNSGSNNSHGPNRRNKR